MLGWTTVCGVELAPFARRVLTRRQSSGDLDHFPIWDDVRTFDGRPWRGSVDVISGGFPCQPFSSASRGRKRAVDLWPEMLRIVGEVQPRWVIAENVQRAPIDVAARALARLGYMVRCAQVGGAHVGAPHQRRRFWLVADAHHEGQRAESEHEEVARAQIAASVGWAEPPTGVVLGMDDGLAGRLDRLRAVGNGQMPHVFALAWLAFS